ncbi:serine hydrolase domain-containing protein [Microbacterium sp. BWT-B31]|uniref:serine hydrolase domain-containing protein n=1 Tax=Microbacterium sp. BWT-B31 TaxID=3232072 RepID=UPI003526D737
MTIDADLDTALPVSTPSAEGADAAGILALVDALESDPAQQPHCLVILRHGRVIARGSWAPYSAARPQLVYSLSKSFAAAAAGLLVDAGEIDLDAPVISYFPEWADDITDERSRRVLVRHVAAMAAGHRDEMIDEAFRADPAEPVRGFLLQPPDAEPGTLFAYSQPNTYTLAAIVQRLRGTGLIEVLRGGVLGPIGATDPMSWQEYPKGRAIGYAGAFVTTDTIARLGQLLLSGGEWNGRRVLSREWVEAATSAQVATLKGEPTGVSDSELGYGFQHWVSRHGFRGDGAFGQFCLVLPESGVVVALQSETGDMQGTLDHVWRHLLPALAGPGTAAADAALAARLASAELPPLRVEGEATPSEGWTDAAFADAESNLRARVRRDAGQWRLELSGTRGAVSAPFAPGDGWRVAGGVPEIAVSGGFEASDRLRLDVAFLEAPHRLHLTLDLAAGTLTARWRTTPLSNDPAQLLRLAAPRPLR